MSSQAYKLDRPESRTSCVVFASPHSGNDYPDWFLQRSVLNAHSIRSSEDAFVDRLFDQAPTFGAPLLRAGVPRACVDFNRSADELDPALISGVRGVGNNPRVASGLGVIPRVVSNGRAIYRGKIRLDEAETRLEAYWRPYHKALQSLLNESLAKFGQAILLDCHSMPREALDALRTSGGTRPEIVLGDRFGTSASSEIVEQVEAAFAGAGFTVSRNAPFAGAYVTQHYGRLGRNQHAIQIEIDRSIYMDEKLIQPHSGFEEVRSRLQKVIAEVVTIGGASQNLAAE
ncbi:N-formylglutamate amidohydrolase [Cognatishimia sp.]|uniref:N-formylglutamate amidohydrolase n=1 Tax=Cognatishimia sp. TaxID=2211648 RepID=UPI0035195F1D